MLNIVLFIKKSRQRIFDQFLTRINAFGDKYHRVQDVPSLDLTTNRKNKGRPNDTAMKSISDLKDLMVEQLRGLYFAETQLKSFLVKVDLLVTQPDLKKILKEYVKENEDQILKLKRAFNHLYVQKRGETCKAMEGLIKESYSLIKKSSEPQILEATIITVLQHIIHYKIAGYGAVCTYAKMLDMLDVAELIHPNLETEKKTDKQLAIVAEEVVNKRALLHDN